MPRLHIRSMVAAIILIKIAFAACFSSDYPDRLFRPFVAGFLDHPGNPWDRTLLTGAGDEFPYHPLMLIILSAAYAPCHFLFGDEGALARLSFQLPALVADLSIFLQLFLLFRPRTRQVIFYYYASPIVLYAGFMHAQLDLIPTALFLTCAYSLVTGWTRVSALFFAAALLTKLHVLAMLPILVIFVIRRQNMRQGFQYMAIVALLYLTVCAPVLASPGFQQMVLLNSKQMSLLSVTVTINGIDVYLPVLVLCLLYGRFLLYPKVNNDLLFTYLTMGFLSLVFLVKPSPGWYLWAIPYLCIFFVKEGKRFSSPIWMHWAFSSAYLVYFVFFSIREHHDLSLMGHPLDLKVTNPTLHNFAFTLLESMVLGAIYSVYRFGIQSNSLYRRKYATVIGIAGDSGSGKSFLMESIHDLIQKGVFLREEGALSLETDSDHKWERGDASWQLITHLNPKANALHRQADQIRALKHGRSVLRGEYDHESGRFTLPRNVNAREIIIVSGLHPFYLPKMRKLIDIKIFLDTDEKIRRHWKILRDTSERGHDKETVLKDIERRSQDRERFILSQRSFADIRVRYFTEDEFEVGDPAHQPTLKLALTVDASLPLERLVDACRDEGVEVAWDYAEDLENQTLIFADPVEASLIERLSWKLVDNLEELVGLAPRFCTGFRGLVQLVVLVAISETLKDAHGT